MPPARDDGGSVGEPDAETEENAVEESKRGELGHERRKVDCQGHDSGPKHHPAEKERRGKEGGGRGSDNGNDKTGRRGYKLTLREDQAWPEEYYSLAYQCTWQRDQEE